MSNATVWNTDGQEVLLYRIIVTIFGVFLWAACGQQGVTQGSKDVLFGTDTSALADLPASAETMVPDTAKVGDTSADPDTAQVQDTQKPVADSSQSGCEEGEGCFLDPCDNGDDCLSGWCVEHMNKAVCTKTCDATCPQGWECKPVSTTGSDVTYVCLSPHTHLCRPCSQSSDCVSTLGVEDVCIRYGNAGSFCGSVCDQNEQCPDGFSCQEAETVDGVMVSQCVLDEGLCSCTDKDVELGHFTSCAVENDDGLCSGVRFCKKGGLTACQVDDDTSLVCDVSNDYGTCAGTKTCGASGMSTCDVDVEQTTPCESTNAFGTCAGVQACTQDGPTACDAAEPVEEVCNGVDDDCDGQVDEDTCDDENVCTKDVCQGAAGCKSSVEEGKECLDGDPCTSADHCDNGTCVGTAVTCFDGNDCTDDPACSPTDGCVYPSNQAACDDGNPCTEGDACAGGVCASGQKMLACDDDNDCTIDNCDINVGCVFGQVADGAPCANDGLCKSGECKPPIQPNCLAWQKLLPDAEDGIYKMDPDGSGPLPVFNGYCDMTYHGGGWTLVFRDNQDYVMSNEQTGTVGNPGFWLKLKDGPSAKWGDATINALRTQVTENITWRVTAATMSLAYFFPGSCAYKHTSHKDPACMRYTPTYGDEDMPAYTQCESWGGGGGGLNAWFNCNGFGYTNVVKTHSKSLYGGACITSNPMGVLLGKKGGAEEQYPIPGCSYGNKVLLWVK